MNADKQRHLLIDTQKNKDTEISLYSTKN